MIYTHNRTSNTSQKQAWKSLAAHWRPPCTRPFLHHHVPATPRAVAGRENEQKGARFHSRIVRSPTGSCVAPLRAPSEKDAMTQQTELVDPGTCATATGSLSGAPGQRAQARQEEPTESGDDGPGQVGQLQQRPFFTADFIVFPEAPLFEVRAGKPARILAMLFSLMGIGGLNPRTASRCQRRCYPPSLGQPIRRQPTPLSLLCRCSPCNTSSVFSSP